MNIQRIIEAVRATTLSSDFNMGLCTNAADVLIEEGLMLEDNNGHLDVDLAKLAQIDDEQVKEFVLGMVSVSGITPVLS